MNQASNPSSENAAALQVQHALQLRQEQKKRNLRTGLILASVALVFFVGIITKYVLLKR